MACSRTAGRSPAPALEVEDSYASVGVAAPCAPLFPENSEPALATEVTRAALSDVSAIPGLDVASASTATPVTPAIGPGLLQAPADVPARRTDMGPPPPRQPASASSLHDACCAVTPPALHAPPPSPPRVVGVDFHVLGEAPRKPQSTREKIREGFHHMCGSFNGMMYPTPAFRKQHRGWYPGPERTAPDEPTKPMPTARVYTDLAVRDRTAVRKGLMDSLMYGPDYLRGVSGEMRFNTGKYQLLADVFMDLDSDVRKGLLEMVRSSLPSKFLLIRLSAV